MLDAKARNTIDWVMFSTGNCHAANNVRNLLLAMAIACSGCCHPDDLRPPSPDPSRRSTNPCTNHREVTNNKSDAASQATRTSLSFFFTPATFTGKLMKLALRVSNAGEVPIFIQSVEIIGIDVPLPRPASQPGASRVMGGMHTKGDHDSSRIPAGEPDAWSFSLPFPCAPFMQLTLQTTAINEATGNMDVITFVSGVEAYEGCPEGWEKAW